MDEAHNKLLERLRTYYGDDLACRTLLMDARHAIEALAGEVERLKKNHEALQDKFDSMRTCACQYDSSDAVCMSHSPALKAAEAERDRLKAEYDAYRETSCESISCLKSALLDIKHFGAGFAQDRARKALGDAS